MKTTSLLFAVSLLAPAACKSGAGTTTETKSWSTPSSVEEAWAIEGRLGPSFFAQCSHISSVLARNENDFSLMLGDRLTGRRVVIAKQDFAAAPGFYDAIVEALARATESQLLVCLDDDRFGEKHRVANLILYREGVPADASTLKESAGLPPGTARELLPRSLAFRLGSGYDANRQLVDTYSFGYVYAQRNTGNISASLAWLSPGETLPANVATMVAALIGGRAVTETSLSDRWGDKAFAPVETTATPVQGDVAATNPQGF